MLAHIRDVLAQVHPDFPWVFLATAIWLVQYLVRRYEPRVWMVCFSWIPADLPQLAQQVIQALPSTVIGAAIPALASGGDVNQAVKGAIFGALAPVWHHLLKAAPGSYAGALNPAKLPVKVPSVPPPAA